METNILGLNKIKSEEITATLNLLLSSFQTYYQNLRGIHWNIKGKQFFELHVKFEELYTDANIKVDEIAERIFMYVRIRSSVVSLISFSQWFES